MLVCELIQYLDQLLQPTRWRDSCPNGLQVAGSEKIQHLVTGVTANQALLNAAIEVSAQAVLVHHGYFWQGENPCIVGIKQKRISTLLKYNLNLIAYHLPLDGHMTLGNNIQLARVLNLEVTQEFSYQFGPAIALIGKLPVPMTAVQFADYLHQKLCRPPFYIVGNGRQIERIAWCTGAGQNLIEEAIRQGVDAYLTGEVSEHTVHSARESGIHFFAAGHHATERYGIQALGEHVAEKFSLKHQYIEIDSPV